MEGRVVGVWSALSLGVYGCTVVEFRCWETTIGYLLELRSTGTTHISQACFRGHDASDFQSQCAFSATSGRGVTCVRCLQKNLCHCFPLLMSLALAGVILGVWIIAGTSRVLHLY
jgi:hypothetical protein